MKISVILPVYNVATYLAKSIDSVLKQTYQNFELIVINDGSTDDSLGILHSFTDERVVVLDQENKGKAYALNRGIRAAKGEYIAFIDGDDLWENDKLENQINIFELNPALEISFGKFEQFLSEELVQAKRKFRFIEKPASGLLIQTCLAKKEIFEKYGFFPDGKMGEFIIWFDHARSKGLNYYMSEDIVAYRRIRENSLSQHKEYYSSILTLMKEKLDKKRNEEQYES